MSVLKVASVADITGLGGFTFTSGSITANGTLKVNNININGSITGGSDYIIPSMSGQSGKFLSNDGTNLVWSNDISAGGGTAGFRSMQVWTSNGTWNRPSDCKSIQVIVVGAGGGGSGYSESAGAGGCSRKVIDVSNISSVSVSIGNPGGGTNYSGCGGSGNTSSFGSHCSASGGYGANCRSQHCGGIGGNGSGGNMNAYGGGGHGYGSWAKYGNHSAGMSYWGGSQPSSHQQSNYAHRHQSHAAWGAGGNGSRFGNRGARGREGVVVVYEYAG
tara:strand:- start:2027 stop:2848 length:822 start_codon:yes stop_codon:yes gene_type:complete